MPILSRLTSEVSLAFRLARVIPGSNFFPLMSRSVIRWTTLGVYPR